VIGGRLELRAGETAPYVGDALLLEIVAGGWKNAAGPDVVNNCFSDRFSNNRLRKRRKMKTIMLQDQSLWKIRQQADTIYKDQAARAGMQLQLCIRIWECPASPREGTGPARVLSVIGGCASSQSSSEAQNANNYMSVCIRRVIISLVNFLASADLEQKIWNHIAASFCAI
jgi:hypothetical protein